MAVDEFEFSNRVGIEMWQLLMKRADAEAEDLTPKERLSILMGAALVSTASVLGPAVAGAPDREAARRNMVALASQWLGKLLEPAVNPRKP